MKEEIKYIWIDALTSGEYKKGRGYLKQSISNDSEIRFCSLGVLADIYTGITGRGKWEKESYDKAQGEFKWVRRDRKGIAVGYATCELPHEIQEWAGMRDTDGSFPYVVARQFSLIDLNDQTHLTFKDIAEVIFEQL